ncbi:TreP protein, partial [Brachyspira pilosicoli]
MKKYILFFLIFSISVLYGQLQIFKPFRQLHTINTEKFEIIFPIESRRSAEKLAGIADDIYEEYSKILNSTVYGKIPVVITPDINLFNSVAVPVPYPRIILFDTAESGELTIDEDNFRGTFIHELVHLLSLNSEKAGIQTRIFGSWASLVFINTPGFMLEGVTVSMESYKGFGRANDPLVKQRLRQDIYEGKFKTPMQASDLWRKRPGGTVYYEYGGLFSKYLQERFGMDKYNELWEAMRHKFSFSFNVYNAGFYGAFKKVYNIDFLDVWGEFQNYIMIKNINPSEALRVNDKETYIEDIDSYDDTLYYIDSNLGALYSYKKIRNNENNK